MENKNEFVKVVVDGAAYETKLTPKYRRRKPYAALDPRKIFAFIPGVITQVYVYEGQKVAKGQSLLVLEAMKMKNDVLCPLDGRVKSIHVKASQMVVKGQLLVELE